MISFGHWQQKGGSGVGGLPNFFSLFHQLCFWSIYSQMQMFWTLKKVVHVAQIGGRGWGEEIWAQMHKKSIFSGCYNIKNNQMTNNMCFRIMIGGRRTSSCGGVCHRAAGLLLLAQRSGLKSSLLRSTIFWRTEQHCIGTGTIGTKNISLCWCSWS